VEYLHENTRHNTVQRTWKTGASVYFPTTIIWSTLHTYVIV
jgi:hypothetical protein